MSGLPLTENNLVYDNCIKESIKALEILIKRERKNAVYFNKLIKLASREEEIKVFQHISTSSKERNETLSNIYLELAKKKFTSSRGTVNLNDAYKKALIWALLDKFETIKQYRSLLEHLICAEHRAPVFRIINDETNCIAKLNSLLIP